MVNRLQAYCHPFNWSIRHLVTWSLGHLVTQSLSHSVTIFNIANGRMDNIRTYRHPSQTIINKISCRITIPHISMITSSSKVKYCNSSGDLKSLTLTSYLKSFFILNPGFSFNFLFISWCLLGGLLRFINENQGTLRGPFFSLAFIYILNCLYYIIFYK